MDINDLKLLQHRQDGVVSRPQARAAGLSDNDIERLLRRRAWAVVHRGVYLDHTAAPTWNQRAWAGVLCCWPALLDGTSALFAYDLNRSVPPPPVISVLVDARRTIRAPHGVRVRRTRDLARVGVWGLTPPRTTLENAVLVAASSARHRETQVALVADACQSGRTSVRLLSAELGQLPRLVGRAFLGEVLGDVAAGAMSPLERRYLRDVERAHGLPRGDRQARLGSSLQDVRYRATGLVVELDGRLGHEWAAEVWKDLDRDIRSAEADLLTVRLGWRQVLRPCRTAQAVARVLHARGWRGSLHACGPACRAARP